MAEIFAPDFNDLRSLSLLFRFEASFKGAAVTGLEASFAPIGYQFSGAQRRMSTHESSISVPFGSPFLAALRGSEAAVGVSSF